MGQLTPQERLHQKRVLNVRALAVIVVSGVMLSLTLSWLHDTQSRRAGAYLKARAFDALTADDPRMALDLLDQYLLLKPKDFEAQEKLASILEEHGSGTRDLLRAFQINERLLLLKKSRDDLRMRQIRIAARLNRFADVSVHLRKLRDARSDLSMVWHYSGIVARDTGDFSTAIKYFEKAISLPNPVEESFEILAELQTEQQQNVEAAEQTLNHMVVLLGSPSAHIIRARWLLKQKRQREAIDDLWIALNAKPDDVTAVGLLLTAIRTQKEAEHTFDAAAAYRRLTTHVAQLLQQNPDEQQLRLYAAAAWWALDDHASAIDILQTGVERDPRNYVLREALTDYLLSDEQVQRAADVFAGIPERGIDEARRFLLLGRLQMAQGRWSEAVSALDKALNYADNDPETTSRAQMCLAICRSKQGDGTEELESYMALVHANPDSENSRLGLAAAYARAGRLDLAIAEYRQLLHVEGVPEYLASLMIRKIMQEPVHRRDWSDVEELVRDDSPVIHDEVQRTLLQADLRFAQGYPSKAFDLLEAAAARHPEHQEFQRALQRITSVHADGLNNRVMTVLNENPLNLDAHLCVLRLQVLRGDADDMTMWLNGLFQGRVFPEMSVTDRLKVIAEATTKTLESSTAQRASDDQLTILHRFADAAWLRLVELQPRNIPHYVRYLAIHQSVAEAVRYLTQSATQVPAALLAQGWVECLKADHDNSALVAQVDAALQQLMRSHPDDVALQLAKADSLLFSERYDQAVQVLAGIVKTGRAAGASYHRLAWLAVFAEKNPAAALEYSRRAVLAEPSDMEVRSLRALILAESGQIQQALDMSRTLRQQEAHARTALYTARLLQLAGMDSAARATLATPLADDRDLRPAERRLLQALKQSLQVESPRMTSR